MRISQKEPGLLVDIDTRIVAEDEDIYIVQPGEGYWLYETFKASSSVFLDFPDLELDFARPPPDRDAFREMIVRSLAIKEWINSGRRAPGVSRDLADYKGKASGRRLGRYVGAAKRLYFELKPGTIVVSPGPSYADDILIGEIVGRPAYVARRSLYGRERVPCRKVRWLRGKPKAAFSSDLRDRLGTPNPLMQLDRSLRAEVLWAGYDQFAFDGVIAARLNTTETEFRTLDDFNIQAFVNYVAGVLAAVELGHKEELDLTSAVAVLRANPSFAPDLTQNINSIGFQRLASDTVVPLAIAALLAVAIAGGASAHTGPIQIKNSAGTKGDPCAVMVAQRVAGALTLMKLDEWKRLCEGAKDVHASTGLSTTMRVKEGTRGSR